MKIVILAKTCHQNKCSGRWLAGWPPNPAFRWLFQNWPQRHQNKVSWARCLPDWLHSLLLSYEIALQKVKMLILVKTYHQNLYSGGENSILAETCHQNQCSGGWLAGWPPTPAFRWLFQNWPQRHQNKVSWARFWPDWLQCLLLCYEMALQKVEMLMLAQTYHQNWCSANENVDIR